ncbi:MAG TPA: hypothetical protein ENH82_05325 [bacterium]|nr:hypothetical protein [bacterium]
MKTYYLIALILIAVVTVVSAYILNNPGLRQTLSKNQSHLLKKAEIIKMTFVPITSPDITEEYHLWLKMEIPKEEYDNLMANTQDPEILPDFLNIKIFSANNPSGQSPNMELPLISAKDIFFMPVYAKLLTDDIFLEDPHISYDQIDYNTQFYTETTGSGNVIVIYIHLESNIKPKELKKVISVTITHQKNYTTIASKTLESFSY